jgi:cbb3-type cytochrome oxidase maturation protein
MTVYYLIVFGSLFCLTGSALLALRWALRSGQFQHLSRTALQIFDEEEPVGRCADRFPGEPPHPGPTVAIELCQDGNRLFIVIAS